MDSAHTTGPAPILVLRKISQILDCFTPDAPEHTLQQLVQETGFPSSTCQRLVQNMLKEGYLDRDGSRYRIGIRMIRWATTGSAGMDIVQLIKPILQDLRDQTGETACLYVRDGAFRTIVAVAETREVVMRPFAVGMVMPIHAGAPGKIFLAYDPEARRALEQSELEKFTPQTPGSLKELDRQIQTARSQQYFAAFGERHSDVASIAAPVFDASGALVAALGLGFPTQRVHPGDVPRLGPQVAQAAQAASQALGFVVGRRASETFSAS